MGITRKRQCHARESGHPDLAARAGAVIGVGKAFASPPSEPYVRFSRIRLSSRWFPHREWLARSRPVFWVNSPGLAKEALRPPLTPLPSADTMQSVQIVASTHVSFHAVGSSSVLAQRAILEVCCICCIAPNFSHPTPCHPSLGSVLLAAPLSGLYSQPGSAL